MGDRFHRYILQDADGSISELPETHVPVHSRAPSGNVTNDLVLLLYCNTRGDDHGTPYHYEWISSVDKSPSTCSKATVMSLPRPSSDRVYRGVADNLENPILGQMDDEVGNCTFFEEPILEQPGDEVGNRTFFEVRTLETAGCGTEEDFVQQGCEAFAAKLQKRPKLPPDPREVSSPTYAIAEKASATHRAYAAILAKGQTDAESAIQLRLQMLSLPESILASQAVGQDYLDVFRASLAVMDRTLTEATLQSKLDFEKAKRDRGVVSIDHIAEIIVRESVAGGGVYRQTPLAQWKGSIRVLIHMFEAYPVGSRRIFTFKFTGAGSSGWHYICLHIGVKGQNKQVMVIDDLHAERSGLTMGQPGTNHLMPVEGYFRNAIKQNVIHGIDTPDAAMLLRDNSETSLRACVELFAGYPIGVKRVLQFKTDCIGHDGNPSISSIWLYRVGGNDCQYTEVVLMTDSGSKFITVDAFFQNVLDRQVIAGVDSIWSADLFFQE